MIAANAAVAVALVGLTVATSPDRAFALWFCAAAAGDAAAVPLAGGGRVDARRAPRPGLRAPWARLGLANLHRPGSATPLMLVSLGLGLSTLAAVALIQGNIRQQVLEQLPANAPTFFFIDIQNDQIDRFDALIRRAAGRQRDRTRCRACAPRIVAVNGVPADQVQGDARHALGAARRPRPDLQRPSRRTARASSPGNGGRPTTTARRCVSFDAGLARGWGVGVGDTIRVNVLGRDIDLKIASLRDIAWRSLSLNFTMVASPGLLEHAPHTHIATVRADAGRAGRRCCARSPTRCRTSPASASPTCCDAVADLLDKIAAALAATGSVTLPAGALVLAGAVAAGQRRRTARGGGAEDARRHARGRSGRPGWSSSA